MCIYIYIYIYMHTHTYIYTHTHVYTHTHTHTHTHTRIHTHKHTHTQTGLELADSKLFYFPAIFHMNKTKRILGCSDSKCRAKKFSNYISLQ